MDAAVNRAKSWRILYTGTCPPHQGGSAISSWLLLRHLAARGHRIRMVVPTTSRDNRLFLPDPLPPTIDVDAFWMPHYATNPFLRMPPFYLERQLRQVRDGLERALAQDTWDLILGGRESFVPGLPELGERYGVPCVGFMRGAMNLVLSGTHPDTAFAASMIDESRKLDLIVPVAEHLAARMRAAGCENVEAVPNGVDVDHFKPAPGREDLRRKLGLPATAKIVIHVSNFKPIKRIDLVVEAATRLIADDPDVFLLLVGDGSAMADTIARCERNGIADNVRMPGWLPNREVADYFNLSDVAVLASDALEVMPRCVLEAMACARPVVAADLPACLELIDHGQDGVICPSGDFGALADGVRGLLRDRSRLRRMGDAARRKMVLNYDIDNIVERFEETVSSVLAQDPAARLVGT